MPWEIRAQIFAVCFEKRYSLGLLYANKQHYAHLRPLLYELLIVSFKIEPSEIGTWAWSPELLLLVIAESSHFECYKDIDRIPVDQFRKIEILIDAPNPDNPGELVSAWKQVTALITALLPRWKTEDDADPKTEADIEIPKGRKTGNLPPIIIKFQEEGEKKWSRFHPDIGRRIWNQSVPSYVHWDEDTGAAPIKLDGLHSDVEIIMTAFLRVRGAASITFELPGDVEDSPQGGNSPVADLVEKVKRLSKRRTPFGLYIDPGCPLDDKAILRYENGFHLWLDHLLDDLKGSRADELRFGRFQFWCSEYDYLMGQRFHNSALSVSLLDFIRSQYYDRCVARSVYARKASILLDTSDDPDDYPCNEIWEQFFRDSLIERKSENSLWTDNVHNFVPIPVHLLLPERRECTTYTQWSAAVTDFSDQRCKKCEEKLGPVNNDFLVERYKNEQTRLCWYLDDTWEWDSMYQR
ncbi:hypothetical protein AYL99_11640 [Fonsecaea erecta]|uniref:Uncharacterized protein n=1 Tax=Fonsecaea erecta TaxID=1367422 RepID=A0A178Z4U4_9EURO|nr:hypothetical protein AYL99_11640 [Fonsecaea erecta]OAP54105.1 hypothetical protein AYL99_11640 [Fonsecaea erecta]